MILKHNKQLDEEIQTIFALETKRAKDHSQKSTKKNKAITVVLAITMSVLILGSLVYSLITAIMN